MYASTCFRESFYTPNFNIIIRSYEPIRGENLNFKKTQKKYKMTIALLAIFSVLVCLSCVSAADNVNNVSLDNNIVEASTVDHGSQIPCLPVAVQFTSGNGYHWEISPETYGATLMTHHKFADDSDILGSTGTEYFNFFIPDNHHFFIKLVEIDPNGNIVDSVEVPSE